MPDELNIQPAEGQPDLGEEGTAQEPKKFTIPGLEGEYAPEDIAAWKRDSDNKNDWRRALNDKGAELNEVKRRQEEKEQKLAEIERRLNDIDTRVSQPQTPSRDWRSIEDPVERNQVFLEEFSRRADERFDKLERENKQLKEGLTAQQIADKQKAEMQYWQNVADQAIESVLPEDFPEDPKFRKLLQAQMGIELSETDKRNWNPETFARAARNGYELLETFGKTKVEKLIKSKKKGAEVKTSAPGQPPAPEAKNKLSPKMTKAERMAIFKSDPNIGGNF